MRQWAVAFFDLFVFYRQYKYRVGNKVRELEDLERRIMQEDQDAILYKAEHVYTMCIPQDSARLPLNLMFIC